MKWVNVELRKPEANRFREYLLRSGIKFETSDAGHGLTHFECFMDAGEIDKANDFLEGESK